MVVPPHALSLDTSDDFTFVADTIAGNTSAHALLPHVANGAIG